MASQLFNNSPERLALLSREPIGQQRLFTRRHLAILALQAEARLDKRAEAHHRHFYRYGKINTPLDQFTASYLRRIFSRYVVVDVNSLMELILFTRRCISSNIICLADVGKHPLAIRHFNLELKNRCDKKIPLPKHLLNVFFPFVHYHVAQPVSLRIYASPTAAARTLIIGPTLEEMNGNADFTTVRLNRTWQVTAVADSVNETTSDEDDHSN